MDGHYVAPSRSGCRWTKPATGAASRVRRASDMKRSSLARDLVAIASEGPSLGRRDQAGSERADAQLSASGRPPWALLIWGLSSESADNEIQPAREPLVT